MTANYERKYQEAQRFLNSERLKNGKLNEQLNKTNKDLEKNIDEGK